MSVLTQTRRAKGTYPCASCNGVIFPGELHDRKVAKRNGKYVSSRVHLVCPEEARTMLFIEGYLTDRVLAGDRLDPASGRIVNIASSPIPTRPVQKHFSEAGEKKGWKPDDYVALALAALIAVFAFASLLAGYWRGQ